MRVLNVFVFFCDHLSVFIVFVCILLYTLVCITLFVIMNACAHVPPFCFCSHGGDNTQLQRVLHPVMTLVRFCRDNYALGTLHITDIRYDMNPLCCQSQNWGTVHTACTRKHVVHATKLSMSSWSPVENFGIPISSTYIMSTDRLMCQCILHLYI